MDSVVPPGLSLVSVLSLLACSIQVLAAALLTLRYGGQSSAEDRWILLWLFYDVIVHLTLVRPFRTSFICLCLHSVIIWMSCHCHLSTCLWLFIVCCLSSGGTICLHISGCLLFVICLQEGPFVYMSLVVYCLVFFFGGTVCLHVSGCLLFIVCCLSSGRTVCLHVSGRDGGDIRGSAGWTLWVFLLSDTLFCTTQYFINKGHVVFLLLH